MAAAGIVLSQPTTHDGVEHLTAADEFNRVGDKFTAHERRAHALRTHGFAVRDGDGVEFHRRAASRANSFFHLRRQTAQVEVTRHGFDPRVSDTDERTAEIRVGESDGLEHGARAGALAPFGDSSADVLEIHG